MDCQITTNELYFAELLCYIIQMSYILLNGQVTAFIIQMHNILLNFVIYIFMLLNFSVIISLHHSHTSYCLR